MTSKKILTTLIGLCIAGAAHADVNVGVIVSATGPGASLGIPYRNAFSVMPDTLGGEKVNYTILDDGTDPTSATRNARKLVQEQKVDLIIGSGTTPSAVAVAEVASETKTPQISLSPLPGTNAGSDWTFSVPQPMSVMMKTVADHMKAQGVKKVAYIGFADVWGDLVYNGFSAHAKDLDIEVLTNERYARNDTSVMGQVIKLIAAKPDAILIGGSGTPGALPHTTLRDRGYTGPIYHNPAVINKDFLRVGGSKIEGAYAVTGPVIVAEQLPDSNPIKEVALEFIKAYDTEYGPGSHNAFSAYSWDANLLANHAVAEAKKKAQPGTPEFRAAIRDALEQTKELVGTHGVYNMTPTDHTGVDERSAALVQVEKGGWKLVQ
ncbi:ABC transporter substrate-binding protein [Pusillimonas sp. CC-YST705]|uniref:ABC transporter substrate-binding protein n=1 Tax=Mesopusillimonas faecipullorum TaxID=2755040 RepID=A0ABS8CCR6_9BURK|nr:ABC transporter substrate-binding protein [Mesopusillimonas faecipullorum]MCB5363793.1 ABC transporter substrate-binding protein [Mesopusillimonas faecipullorum]